MNKIISQILKEHAIAFNSLDEKEIEKAADAIIKAYSRNNKTIIFGNGGSASDAEHFAAELVGRFKHDRKAINAIALTANTSTMTAIGNDFGFDEVFSRQIEAYAKKGDIAIGISTSGNSKNVNVALKKARDLGCFTIGLIGKEGGEEKRFCDLSIIVKHDDTARIQEMHIMIIHILCEIIESSIR